MNKDSKILITGAHGMVGKTMWQLLEKDGYTNLLTPSSDNVDFSDLNSVSGFFEKEKPEYVFHFAAKVGGILANIENPATFLRDNLLISCNVIDCAYKFGVKKILNLGSSCIYPRICPQPMKEEYLLTGPLEPTNEGYALAKISALKLCEYYNKQYLTNFISLMPCNLYGINERFDEKHSHVIASLIIKFHKANVENKPFVELLGTGSARREFLYVEDVARAALYFMLNFSANDLNNTFVNIGSGEDISIKDLAELISGITQYTGEIRWDSSKPDGMPQKLLDVGRMKELKFEPKISLKEGIKRTYDFYLSKY